MKLADVDYRVAKVKSRSYTKLNAFDNKHASAQQWTKLTANSYQCFKKKLVQQVSDFEGPKLLSILKDSAARKHVN